MTAKMIIPAQPGYRYMSVTRNDADEHLAEYRAADDKVAWIAFWSDDIVAWRISDDDKEVYPITFEGVQDHSLLYIGGIIRPDGLVTVPGELDFYNVEEFLTCFAKKAAATTKLEPEKSS